MMSHPQWFIIAAVQMVVVSSREQSVLMTRTDHAMRIFNLGLFVRKYMSVLKGIEAYTLRRDIERDKCSIESIAAPVLPRYHPDRL